MQDSVGLIGYVNRCKKILDVFFFEEAINYWAKIEQISRLLASEIGY